MRYSLPVAYLLWFMSGFGMAGFHRFYLGKYGTGLIWLCTMGLGSIGSLYDLITLPRQVREANINAQLRRAIEARYDASLEQPRKDSPERVSLRIARDNGGFVTAAELALEADLSIEEAGRVLEKLAKAGQAQMRVRSNGVIVYFFAEFSREGRDEFAL